jgi:putative transposase
MRGNDLRRGLFVLGRARYEHVRGDARVISMAVLVAYGVRADGLHDVLGIDVGPNEDVAVWRVPARTRSPQRVGVKLVTAIRIPNMLANVSSWTKCIHHLDCSPAPKPKRRSWPGCSPSVDEIGNVPPAPRKLPVMEIGCIVADESCRGRE